MQGGSVGAVAIGRNEGAKLGRCLQSLTRQVGPVVYVDSGSTDGSVEAARAAGAEVVELDPSVPFTAARARNAGFDRLREVSGPEFVQFVDGDCELAAGWTETALAAITRDECLAVVCGRRRERHPEASLYNRLIDREWDTPPGPAKSCGGDSLMRAAAFREVGGFNPDLIAGEEPELCVRLRAAGWKIARIDAEMTLHDADITRFSQWWQRNRRAGHAFAEGAHLHGRAPERHRVAETRRALLWGAALPLAAVILALVATPWALALLLAYPLQILRLGPKEGWARALFLTIGKFAEAQGALGYYWTGLRGRRRGLMEYK